MAEVLGDEQAYVEEDDEDIDDYEISDDFPLQGLFDGKDGLETSCCFPDVEA